MSELDMNPLYRFKEGDEVQYTIGGITADAVVTRCRPILADDPMPSYDVQRPDTGGVFTMCENMLEPKYGVSYIASAPEELKVGDRVEVVDEDSCNFGTQGEVVSPLMDGSVRVHIDSDEALIAYPSKLRKLPDTISFEEKDNPLERQVGGSHYKDMAIQPVEFCMRNNLNFCVSSAIKYLCRYKNKNGKQDLEKAKHFIDLLIQMEYHE